MEVETSYRGHRFLVDCDRIRVMSPSGRHLGWASSFAGARRIVRLSLKRVRAES